MPEKPNSRPELAFLDAMQVVLGRLDFIPVGDGVVHRFHVPGDKPGTKNGCYGLFMDDIASGWFGTWRHSEPGSWKTWSSRKPANKLEQVLIKQCIERAMRQREAMQLQRQHAAAQHANQVWKSAKPANPRHPYLLAKGVDVHNLRQRDGQLLVPMVADGQLVNLQRIFVDDKGYFAKHFLLGGRVVGTYSPLGAITPGCRLYICEGWATGATLFEHYGSPVAVAMNSGNLLAVGLALKARYGDCVELVIASDDDRVTAAKGKGNPGRKAAIAAATALNCGEISPAWPPGAPLSLTDFNDLRQWMDKHNDHAN